MPRLLLVDDNPSIHRIAESLLAPTDVELVCVDSAAEALDRLGHGERFDVALVDTAMPGMDGWTLLGRLRAMDETARMPIALMAGVLDPVDPAKLAKAPIQGFLKKPIELRELGDRVKALLTTPVPAGPSPFSTVPATPAADLVKRAEAALPEFRPDPSPVADPVLDLPELDLPEEDLLVLTAEDMWPETPAMPVEAAAAPALDAAPEVHLELEELDLDSLQDLAAPPEPPPAAPEPEPAEVAFLAEALAGDLDLAGVPDAAGEPALDQPAAALSPAMDDDDALVTLSGLEELDIPLLEAAPVAAVAPPSEPLEPPAAAPMAEDRLQEPSAPAPAPPAVDGQTAAAPGQEPLPAEQARAVVQALMADPVLVDALVRAIVARMGDQVLREIAWEVMPDLAGRLQR